MENQSMPKKKKKCKEKKFQLLPAPPCRPNKIDRNNHLALSLLYILTQQHTIVRSSNLPYARHINSQ